MNENTQYFIRGPMYTHDTCSIAFTKNYVPYYLVRVSESDEYILDPRPDSHKTAVVFRIIGSLQHLSLFDELNSEYLSFEHIQGLPVAKPSKSVAFLSPNESGHAHTGIFLAGVNYTFNNINGEVVHFKRYLHEPVTTGQQPSNITDIVLQTSKVRIIPHNVLISGACGQAISPSEVLDLDRMDSLGQQVQQRLFTRTIDCERGVFYKYCDPQQQCGPSDCFGPCPVLHGQGTCVFNDTLGSMSCSDCIFAKNNTIDCLNQTHKTISGIVREPITIIMLVLGIILVLSFIGISLRRY